MSEYKFWVVKDGQLHLFCNPHQDFEPMSNDIEWGELLGINFHNDEKTTWKDEEEEEEKCSTCGKRLNDAELIEDICGLGCDEYDKGLLETREYPTIEEILSKMKELKEDENEWDDDTIYDAICEWDDKFADDPNWFDEEDTDVKDSLRDDVCEHLGLGEFKKEEEEEEDDDDVYYNYYICKHCFKIHSDHDAIDCEYCGRKWCVMLYSATNIKNAIKEARQ